jgi:hypothetical protein
VGANALRSPAATACAAANAQAAPARAATQLPAVSGQPEQDAKSTPLCREVLGQHINAKAVAFRQQQDRVHGVAPGVGWVYFNPLVPGALQEIQVARAVRAVQWSAQCGVVDGQHVGGAKRAALPLGQHKIQTLGPPVAIDRVATKHFLLAGVAPMAWVVRAFPAPILAPR